MIYEKVFDDNGVIIPKEYKNKKNKGRNLGSKLTLGSARATLDLKEKIEVSSDA